MEKKPPPTIAEALDQLSRAITRLEQSVRESPELRRLKAEHDSLRAKLAEASRHNDILREAAHRVAARLDGQISRLSAGLGQ
jgi:predicted RNase H-like nuclease (RuvC/YqgF family)